MFIEGEVMTKEIYCDIHEKDLIKEIKNNMLKEEVFSDIADFFKMFGDSTRIKIISALFNGEMCVGAIVEVLEMSQSSISHQLRILKNGRLVKSRKEGKQIFYSLDDMHVKNIFEMGLNHIKE